MTVAQAFAQLVNALETVYDGGEARSIARIVFEDALGVRNVSRSDQLAPFQLARLGQIQPRLLAHEPVQYVLGQADFYGLTFRVNRSVLIPRQETEELVNWVLETLRLTDRLEGGHVLDIGTGSGCIPIVLKKKRPDLVVTAIDVSRDALAVARDNAARHGVEIDFRELDILDAEACAHLPLFDLLVSNPPYIPPSERRLMPAHVTEYEPPQALFTGEEDPLIFYRAIASFSGRHLRPGGWLFLETNEFHARQVRQLLLDAGFAAADLQTDLYGKERMVRARREEKKGFN